MLDDVKKDWMDLKYKWKEIHLKPSFQCNLEQLKIKEEAARHLMYTFTIAFIIFITQMLVLFYYENTASITVDIMVIVSLIALYDEAQRRDTIQLLIYFKEREEEIIETETILPVEQTEEKEVDVGGEIDRIISKTDKKEFEERIGTG